VVARRAIALALGLTVLAPAPAALAAATYTLSVRPQYIPIGAVVRVRFRATTHLGGRQAPVRGAIVALSSHRARTDRTGHATLRLQGERRHPLRARLIVGGRTRAQALLIVG
jgi:hypothetical protein